MEEIIQYYKDKFAAIESLRRGRRKIGVELKFPLVDEQGNAVDYKRIKKLWAYLQHLGWEREVDSFTGETVGVRKRGAEATDHISTETGYCKVEFSLGQEEDLFKDSDKVRKIKGLMASFSQDQKVLFLGYGIQPKTPPSKKLYMRKTRSMFWERLFASNNVIDQKDGTDVHLFTIPASSQVHIEISSKEIVDAINVFNGLAGAQIALNANSPVWKNRVDPDYKAVREVFWDWWLPQQGRTGMPEKRFSSLEDYLATIAGFSPVFVVRGGKPLVLLGFSSFREYYGSKSGCYAESPDGKKTKIFPHPEDIDLHNTFFWYDARLSRYLTLENRVNCQQPPEDTMVVAGLTLGLVENLSKARELIDRYNWPQLKQVRTNAIRKAMQAKVTGGPIADLCEEMLGVAEEGLKQRGLGEEVFLVPLQERLRRRECSADRARELFQAGGVQALVQGLKL